MMSSFLPRRLAALIPLLVTISMITFLLLDSSQGDYLSRLEADPSVSDEQLESLRVDFGLDRPLVERYLRWLGSAAAGKLGRSFRYHMDVGELIWGRLGNTLLLALCAMIVAWGAGLVLGIAAAACTMWRRWRLVDRCIGILCHLGLSMPRVFLALLAVLLADLSGCFPIGGMHDELLRGDLGAWERFLDTAHHLVLPTLVLGLTAMPAVIRQMRAHVIEAISSDYVRTARAKGMGELCVLFRHAARNAINPMITLWGQSLGTLVTGSFLVEVVMAWPGMAMLTLEALLSKDVYLVMAAVMITSLTLVLGNLVADILLAVTDPRIRLEDVT